MKKLLLVIGMATALFACRDRTVYLRSFVTHYYDITAISLISHPESKFIGIYASIGYGIGNYRDEGERKIVYDSLCEKHHDMYYQRVLYEIVPFENDKDYPAIDFLSLKITSDADYDAAHPAGSSLGDIVKFVALSAKNYIDSGYQMFDWTSYSGTYFLNPEGPDPYYPVEKLVSELRPEDLILLGTGGGHPTYWLGDLFFQNPPDLSKAHTFTVTMAADDGSVFSASVEMTFN